jgi:hypothetical protein
MIKIKKILSNLKLSVASGLFRGTKCEFTESGAGIVSKLVGTYELELHPALSEIIDRKPEVVVNIGAAEGFYVSALARKLPSSKIIAFEAMDSWYPHLQRNLKINGVENRCDIRGFCSVNDFENLICELGLQSTFVLMDIEGGEFDLITHSIMQKSKHIEFLIEIHDWQSQQKGDDLVALLGKTHEVSIIQQDSNLRFDRLSGFLKFFFMFSPFLIQKLDERRNIPMRWVWAIPN